MQHLIKIMVLLVLNTAFSFAQELDTYSVTVIVSNLDSNEGKVYVGLYNTESRFLSKGLKYTNAKIVNNTCKVVFTNIPNGVYAVSMYHDENNNGKMDTGIFGIPREDYGCSNNAKGFMGPPKWEDAKFTLNNKSITQHIKL